MHRRRLRYRLRKRLLARHETNNVQDTRSIAPNVSKNKNTARKAKCVWGRLDENGVKVPLLPEQSMWYTMYVDNSLITIDESMLAKFRRRFRLPYNNYIELVEMCCEDKRFERWTGFKINRVRTSPIQLLVLGSLRYLGRGFTFDDIEECTAVSRHVHRDFFHAFIDFGRHVLYPKYVSFPRNSNEATTHIAEFLVSGFPGCVGSSDCTHITTHSCEYARNQHIGQKSSSPTRSFSLTVNH